MSTGSAGEAGTPVTDRHLRPDWRDHPRPDRFAADAPGRREAMAAHRAAIEAGRPGYPDPATGLYVMTSVHLRDRGWCCDRGCRHCPYQPADRPAGDDPGRSGAP